MGCPELKYGSLASSLKTLGTNSRKIRVRAMSRVNARARVFVGFQEIDKFRHGVSE